MATTSYEGATLTTITTGSGNIYVQLTLPSGRTFPNVYQWGVMWQEYIDDPNTTPEDRQALIALQSNQSVVNDLYQQAQAEQTPPPTIPEGSNTELPNDSSTGDNQAKDDQGQPSDSSNPDTKSYGNDPQLSSTTEGAAVTNSGTTTAGKSGASQLKQGRAPTVRKNPLGYLSNYTYQLTLYMVTPDALNAFRQSGRRNINNLASNPSGGAYIVLQSGGINNTVSKRAPGFELDYYIDNLQIKHLVSPNENLAPTVSTTLSFNIIEPYGFSFLSRLKEASDQLEKYSRTLNIKGLENSTRQFFILGIRFQGYDKYGKLLTGKETIDGRVIDPTGSGNGLFETFYEIMFKKVSFKIDGKVTTYNIEAISLNADALGTKRAMIPTQVTTESTTVDEAIQGPTGLLTIINSYYRDSKLDVTPAFKVEYVGDINDLKNATIVLPEDTTKWKWPIKRDPNDPTGAKAIPDSTKKMISFSNSPSMSILTAIEKIITQSSFLSNALKASYTNEVMPEGKTKEESEIKPDSVKYLRWFNITTNVKILGYSNKLNDFVYETTFVISPYETPIVLSTYVKNFPKYYGPVKRYEYWFTGQNTEVINYEQTNNNGYFLVSLDPNLDNGKTTDIPKNPALKQGNDNTGRLYAGSESIGSITTNLYDPKSYANAKMTILGDPDFLTQDSLNYDVATKAFNQFYAPNGVTINPTGGQIFIEVDFKEGVDYNYKTGLFDINDSITFWQYPEKVKKLIKGVSFQVKRITSTFRGGKFTQDLEMFINQIDENTIGVGANDLQNARDGTEVDPFGGFPGDSTANGARQGTGSVATSTNDATSSSTGLTPEPVYSEGPADEDSDELILFNDPDSVEQNTSYSEEDSGREGE